MEKSFYYNFHNLVRMTVVIKNYNRFLSRTLEDEFVHYRTNDKIKDPDILVVIGSFKVDALNCTVFDGRYYVKKDYIFREHVYKIAKWKVAIKGFTEEKTTLHLEPNAPAWWVFPGGTIHAMLAYKFIKKGHIMLHASAVSDSEKSYIFTGRSGTGKTITVFSLIAKGYRYLGDDTVMMGRENTLSFIKPLNIRFTYDVQKLLGVRFSGAEKVFIFTKKILRILSGGYINLFTKINAQNFFPDKLGKKSITGKIFFMKEGPTLTLARANDSKALARQIVANIKFELEELWEYALAYGYLFPSSGVFDIWKEAFAIAEAALTNVPAYLVSMPKQYPFGRIGVFMEKMNERD